MESPGSKSNNDQAMSKTRKDTLLPKRNLVMKGKTMTGVKPTVKLLSYFFAGLEPSRHGLLLKGVIADGGSQVLKMFHNSDTGFKSIGTWNSQKNSL